MFFVLELIGLIIYAIILALVLIIVFIRSSEENRVVLITIVFLFGLIGLNLIISIPIVEFFLFILVILDIYYLIYVHILPHFYTRSDRLLFVEVTNEVWDHLKVNETIKEKDKEM